jgi:transcriptional regulator with XRE-family HTH domain
MTTLLQVHLINLVRNAMDARNTTQSEVAIAVGMSDTYLSHMMNGESSGSLTTWDKLLRHFKILRIDVL